MRKYPRPENLDELVSQDKANLLHWYMGTQISKGFYSAIVRTFGSANDAIQSFFLQLVRGVPSIVRAGSTIRSFRWHVLHQIEKMRTDKRSVHYLTHCESSLDIDLNDVAGPVREQVDYYAIDLINKSLESLNYKRKFAVCLTNGLWDGCDHDLLTTGRILRVTRERVRQLQGEAYDKMAFQLQSLSDRKRPPSKENTVKCECVTCGKKFTHKHIRKFCSKECRRAILDSKVTSGD